MAEFVTAYNAHGQAQRVPAHFFDVPALCVGLSKEPPNTPTAPAATRKRTTRKKATRKRTATSSTTNTEKAPAAGDQKE